MQPLDIDSLRTLIWKGFDTNEFSALCNELGVDEKTLSGKGLFEKTNILLTLFLKTGRIKEIYNAINKLKPDLITGQFFFDENLSLPKEALLRDPSLIIVSPEQAGERIIQTQVENPKANALIKNIEGLFDRLEVLADPVAQSKLYIKLEEAIELASSQN
jgi:hypothetical protein